MPLLSLTRVLYLLPSLHGQSIIKTACFKASSLAYVHTSLYVMNRCFLSDSFQADSTGTSGTTEVQASQVSPKESSELYKLYGSKSKTTLTYPCVKSPSADWFFLWLRCSRFFQKFFKVLNFSSKFLGGLSCCSSPKKHEKLTAVLPLPLSGSPGLLRIPQKSCYNSSICKPLESLEFSKFLVASTRRCSRCFTCQKDVFSQV